jgi:hypothetical protein
MGKCKCCNNNHIYRSDRDRRKRMRYCVYLDRRLDTDELNYDSECRGYDGVGKGWHMVVLNV